MTLFICKIIMMNTMSQFRKCICNSIIDKNSKPKRKRSLAPVKAEPQAQKPGYTMLPRVMDSVMDTFTSTVLFYKQAHFQCMCSRWMDV